jgi:hypothetical protein
MAKSITLKEYEFLYIEENSSDKLAIEPDTFEALEKFV